jgi:hypothetical protein
MEEEKGSNPENISKEPEGIEAGAAHYEVARPRRIF